MKNKLNIPQCC